MSFRLNTPINDSSTVSRRPHDASDNSRDSTLRRRTSWLSGSIIIWCTLASSASTAESTATVVVGSTVTAAGQNNHPIAVPISASATTSLPEIVTAPDVPEVVTAPDILTPQPENSPRPSSMPRSSTPTLPIVLERSVKASRPKASPVQIQDSARARNPQQTTKPNLLGGRGILNSPEARITYAINLANQGQHESAMAICNQLLTYPSLSRAQLDRARSCIDFDIPLVRLRDLMTAGQMASAQNLLRTMLRATRPDSDHRRYLLSIRQATAKATPVDEPANPADAVLAEVTRILEQWRGKTGYFPRSYAELNTALPADAPPLVEYDIINYAGNKDEFSVAIRNRARPREVLSLHKTGLLR